MPPPGFKKSIIRFKVERMLTPEHWAEYQVLLKDRRSTIDSLHEWLKARGYKIGRMAVGRHRRRFDADVEGVRRTALLAEELVAAAVPGGPGSMGALADATLARFQQVLLERLMKLDSGKEPGNLSTRDFSTREWLELSKTISESVSARRNLEALRKEFEERARRAAEAVERETAAAKGKSKVINGEQIANCVRRILGIPLDDEPMPDEILPLETRRLPDGTDPILRRVEDAVEEFRDN